MRNTQVLDVNVTGGNKIKRELVEELARFVHAKLMPRKAVEVNIDIGDYEVFGLCGQIDDYEYEIELKDTSVTQMLITLAHEMVHVKQYARNELKQLVRQPMYRWKKEYLPLDTPYFDQPWEKEAYDLEEKLYDEWSNTRNI